MSTEKQNILIEKFPKIFSSLIEYRKTETDIYYPILNGCAVGDGWFKLLYNLFANIQEYIDNSDNDQVIAEQIKEKWGMLRFYYHGGDNVIDGMIRVTEHLSYYTCEKCGTMENVGHTNGYVFSCCKNCIPENLKNSWVEFIYK